MENCIFCKIAQKQAPSKLVWEDENVMAFWDIHPEARVHVLIIPKKHIASLKDVSDQDHEIMGHLLCAVPKVAAVLKLEHFQLRCHTGAASGQCVFHIHLHLLQN